MAAYAACPPGERPGGESGVAGGGEEERRHQESDRAVEREARLHEAPDDGGIGFHEHVQGRGALERVTHPLQCDHDQNGGLRG